ncbi:MAG: hypothetical protein JKX69_03290 [Rhodobacteraceae bacterium]|nr:hypothetical protein [Paracoccaceae bacterium]
MSEENLLVRPELTMPPAEAEALRAGYAAATNILEYGSGGSTVMAAEMSGKTIFSVESDRNWARAMNTWFRAHRPKSKLRLHYANIGPTGKWGMPENNQHYAKFHTYPLSVWQRPDFTHPDTVLIDGRFRAGCFLAVQYMISHPVTVYFDDYTDRETYHDVERFGAPVEIIGRMARFELQPARLENADLNWILSVFTRKK